MLPGLHAIARRSHEPIGDFSLQVCDLYCGRGVDTENWSEAKVGKYVGVGMCLTIQLIFPDSSAGKMGIFTAVFAARIRAVKRIYN